jgi:hypothetical protein
VVDEARPLAEPFGERAGEGDDVVPRDRLELRDPRGERVVERPLGRGGRSAAVVPVGTSPSASQASVAASSTSSQVR